MAVAVPCGAVTLMALVAGAVLVVARRRRRSNESRAPGTAAADAPGPGRLTTLVGARALPLVDALPGRAALCATSRKAFCAPYC